MMRLVLCVGDRPDTGGYTENNNARPYKVSGHQVAIIGGRAYCEACKSMGVIAKAGGPRRINHTRTKLLSMATCFYAVCYIAAHDRAQAKHFHARRHGGINGGSHFQQDRFRRCDIRAGRPV
jgi:hypothetical protein